MKLFLACTPLSPPVPFALPPAVPETALSETRAWYLQTLPKPRSASETPSEGWSRLFLWPSETAVWHPQTLPTLPNPRSASDTAAAPPKALPTLPNLAEPQRLLHPNASNPSNPSKTSQRLRDCCSASENLLWPSETAVWHPQTLPTLPKPRSASETAAAPPRVFYDLPKLLFGTPKRFQPFQPFQNLAAPQRLLQRLRESFMTFRNCSLAPPNASNPYQRFQNLAAPQRLLQRLRESFMTPKRFQPFQTFAAPQRLLQRLRESFMPFRSLPQRVFDDLPKLLFGTPKRFQPFQPFQNLAAPQRLLQCLRESFMTFRNCCLAPPNASNPSNPSKTSQRLRDCCSASESLLWPSETAVWHPQTLPTLPTLPKPRSASETVAVFRESFMTEAPPALPQRLLRKASHTDSLHFPERLSSYRNHKKGVGGTRALAHSICCRYRSSWS